MAIRYFLLIFAMSKRDKEIINLISNKIMDKKTIESNIKKFSQINNSIIKQASSVQSKWEARLIEAQNGALREMRETISSIADVF